MKTPVSKLLIILVLLFLAFGGIYGAILLIVDPSGARIGFPPNLLDGTPFKTYLLPGIILLIFNGLLPLYVFWQTLRRKQGYGWWMAAQGFILLLWLSIQLFINPDFFLPGMHYPFFAVGVILLIIGLMETRKARN